MQYGQRYYWACKIKHAFAVKFSGCTHLSPDSILASDHWCRNSILERVEFASEEHSKFIFLIPQTSNHWAPVFKRSVHFLNILSITKACCPAWLRTAITIESSIMAIELHLPRNANWRGKCLTECSPHFDDHPRVRLCV